MPEVHPDRQRKAFSCPHCRAHTQQSWYSLYARGMDGEPNGLADPQSLRGIAKENEASLPGSGQIFLDIADVVERGDPGLQEDWQHQSARWVINMALSLCFVCERESIWLGEKIIYPAFSAEVPDPNFDLPDDLKRDYIEAAHVMVQSARSACALLRLTIQKLCSHVLGLTGNINEMIGELVKKGLPNSVQKAMDYVRIIGNEAVHPGVIDLRDDNETARNLFRLVNIIADSLISQPKHIDELYQKLPSNKLKGIETRDGPKK